VKSFAAVLIAEENPCIARELRGAIQQRCPASPSLIVDNGDSAMAYLRGLARMECRAITTLLFLSLTIPQVSALQILDWIKRQSMLRSLIVGLLCSVGEVPDLDRLAKYGPHVVLKKPILPGHVAALLAKLENPHSVARQPEQATPAEKPLLLTPARNRQLVPELGLSTDARSVSA
jgi:hypothetical protein